jgi:hypothetical protein
MVHSEIKRLLELQSLSEAAEDSSATWQIRRSAAQRVGLLEARQSSMGTDTATVTRLVDRARQPWSQQMGQIERAIALSIALVALLAVIAVIVSACQP